MKLVRYGVSHQEKPGILDADGQIRDLSGIVSDITGESLSPAALASLKNIELKKLPIVSGKPSDRSTDPPANQPRLGPCVGRVGKFVCIGLNYSDHAAETGLKVPSEPVIFMKASSSICGPNDDIVIPRGGTKTDWEVELGIVIGTQAKYVSEADAMSYIAGYCAVNDVSERADEIDVSRAQKSKERAEERLKSNDPEVDYTRAEDALQRAETRLNVAKDGPKAD